jgi:hypothetical protein
MKKIAKKSIKREFGAVAILDALSASNYTEAEIEEFLRSRDRVLEELNAWVEEPHGSVEIRPKELETFTFNDTIVIVLRGGSASLGFDKVTSFAAVIRKFVVDSMAAGLLFRGAAALGTFRVDTETNTVMGDAVTDAAAWYARTEWVGVHFTPRSFLELSGMYETSGSKRRWAMLPYEVPLRGGEKLHTYAINWPKIFMVPSLSPWKNGLTPRAELLHTLAQHRVPLGTEQKYLNTLAFFEHSLEMEADARKKAEPGVRGTKRYRKRA